MKDKNNYNKTITNKARNKLGAHVSIWGMMSNLFLFVVKLIVGFFSGSIAIITDAFHNLTDGASSIVALISFKISSKPADKTHPFGHARIEYITSLILSLIIIFMGIILFESSITNIIYPHKLDINIYVLIVLLLGILIKIFQMIFYLKYAKKIKSDVLKATAIESRNDIITSSSTLIAMIVIYFTNFNIDAYVATLLAGYIVFSGVKLLLSSVSILMGNPPNKKLITKIKTKLRSYEGVLGTHELMLHSYGADAYYGSVRVEVSANLDAIAIHELIDKIESDFLKQIGINLTIHADPIQNKNPQVIKLKKKTIFAIKQLNKKLSIHNFRINKENEFIILSFDVIIPFEINIQIEEIQLKLDEFFNKNKKKYKYEITLNRNYV